MLTQEEFSVRLKSALGQKKMKQSDLASAIGVSTANISNYVRGKAFPPIDTLVEIAERLEVSLDELCGITSRENNFKPKTYGDIAQSVMCILDAIPHRCDIETIAATGSQCVGIEDSIDGYGKVAHFEDVEVAIPVISFRTGEMRTFITDLMKIRNLLVEKTLDFEFYNRWLNGRIQALKKIPLESIESVYTTEDFDGPLPF